MNTAVRSLPLAASAGSATRRWGLRASIARAGQALWLGLQAAGEARAHRQLLDLADRYEPLQPELAKELRAACRHGPRA